MAVEAGMQYIVPAHNAGIIVQAHLCAHDTSHLSGIMQQLATMGIVNTNNRPK
jgi:hypothetical protein